MLVKGWPGITGWARFGLLTLAPLVVLIPLAHAQNPLLTGDPIVSDIGYGILAYPVNAQVLIGGNDLPAMETSLAPAQAVGVDLELEDGTSMVTPDPAVCGAGCYEQVLGVPASPGTLNIFNPTTSASEFSGTLGNVPGETNAIFAVPGSNTAVIQLALTPPGGGSGEYLILSGTTSVGSIELCNGLGVGECPPGGGSQYFADFTLGGGWTATLQSSPYQLAEPVYLNSAKLGSTGLSWSSSANWLESGGAATPQPGDDVFVTNTTANPTTATTIVTFDAATDPQLRSLTINSSAGGSLVQLSQPANVLTSGNETIGTTGLAEHYQTGGTNNVTGTLTVQGYGTYDLGGGTLNAGTIQVNAGGGFVFDGGTANFGNFNLNDGGTVTAFGNEYVGTATSPVSSFTQAAGTASSNTVAGSLVLGGPGASGTYDLQGGTLTAGGIEMNAGGTFKFDGGTANFGTFNLNDGGTVTASGNEYVGTAASPVSSFTQAAGKASSNTVSGSLVLGGLAASGTYDLQGGTLTAGGIEVNAGGTFKFDGGTANFGTFNLADHGTVTASGDEYVGTAASPVSSLNQAGSTSSNTVAGSLVLGGLGTSGTYDLQGGTLTAGGIEVNAGGTFAFDGGTANFGTFNLNDGGTVLAAGNEIEYVGTAASPVSSFTQAGAASSNTLAGALRLGQSLGMVGSYTLNGGSLTANSEGVGFGGAGIFTQGGGINTVGGLSLGVDPGSNGTYNLRGGSFDQSGGETDIGSTGVGTFIQSGGISTIQLMNIASSSWEQRQLLRPSGRHAQRRDDPSERGRLLRPKRRQCDGDGQLYE